MTEPPRSEMEGEEDSKKDLHNLPLDHLLPPSPSASFPLCSVGLRKSINWACPVATSMQSYGNRVNTRLSGTSASAGPYSESGEAHKSCKDADVHSDEGRPFRVVSYGLGRRGRKQKASYLEYRPTEPPEESNSPSMNQGQPNSQTEKRARIAQGGGYDQLERHAVVEEEQKWVPVPVIDHNQMMDGVKKSETIFSKSSLSRYDNETTKTTKTADDRNEAFCSFSTAWQESGPRRSKTKPAGESKHDTGYKKARNALVEVKTVVLKLENWINEIRDDQLKELRKENRRLAKKAARKQERLLNLISTIVDEKLALERDLESLRKDFAQQLEKCRETLRSELQADHGKTISNLTEEVAKEQDKTICQICLSEPRDTAILPCLHFQYCGTCLRGLKDCPTCRAKINGVLRCNLCNT